MNEIDPALYGMIGVSLIFFALFGIMLAARRRAGDEKNLSPGWETYCSGKIGDFIGVGIPAIRFSIYSDIVVVCFIFPKVFTRSEIVKVERVRRLFFYSALRIRFSNGESVLLYLGRARADEAFFRLKEIQQNK